MRSLNKRQVKNTADDQKVKKLGLNELSDNILLSVAGGQTYHNEKDKLSNEKYIKDLTKRSI